MVCRERGQGEAKKGAEGENPKRGKAGIFPNLLGQLGRAPWPIDRRPCLHFRVTWDRSGIQVRREGKVSGKVGSVMG